VNEVERSLLEARSRRCSPRARRRDALHERPLLLAGTQQEDVESGRSSPVCSVPRAHLGRDRQLHVLWRAAGNPERPERAELEDALAGSAHRAGWCSGRPRIRPEAAVPRMSSRAGTTSPRRCRERRRPGRGARKTTGRGDVRGRIRSGAATRWSARWCEETTNPIPRR